MKATPLQHAEKAVARAQQRRVKYALALEKQVAHFRATSAPQALEVFNRLMWDANLLDDEIETIIVEHIQTLNTYGERSPSGRGVHASNGKSVR